MATLPNPELERRIQERLIIRMSARYQANLRRSLIKASHDAATAYQENGSIEAAVLDINKKIEQALTAMWTDSYLLIGNRVSSALKKATGKSLTGMEYKMSEGFSRGLDNFIRRYSAHKITQISSTTVDLIKVDIQAAVEDGLTLMETAELIRKRGREFADYRSKLIARTEVHSAANAGSIEAAKELELPIKKAWVSAEDERTRAGDNTDFDHTNIEPVGLYDSFDVSGESLMFPGDPSGSAGNVINCRCGVTYEVN